MGNRDNERGKSTPADFSAERLLRKAILFAYGFFLLFLFRNDMIRYFIHERNQFITVAGALILISASILYASRGGAAGKGRRPARRAASWALLGAFLLAPVVWSFAVPVEVHELSDTGNRHRITFAGTGGRPGAEALSRPGPGDVTLKFPAADGSGMMEARVYTPINLLELGILLERGIGDYAGARVAVRGQVSRGGVPRGGGPHSGEPDEFLLTRFTSGWCVVHAAEHAESVAMTVSSPESGNLKRNVWVTVYGRIKERHHDAHDERGSEQPFLIQAEKIEPAAEPAEPIMLKWNSGKPFYF